MSTRAVRLRVSAAELEAAAFDIENDRYHYVARVRRAAVGDELELFGGDGRRRRATIRAATSELMTIAATGDVVESAVQLVRIMSIVPLIKGDRMDFAVAKLTELGVDEIVVVRCEHSVVTLDGERAERRVERFLRIATEAARQCQRDALPRIGPICSFDDGLARASMCALRFVFVPGAVGLRQRLGGSDVGQLQVSDVALLSGPEGGLSAVEIEASEIAGFLTAGLGPRVLRAETAAVAAAAAVSALVGDVGGAE